MVEISLPFSILIALVIALGITILQYIQFKRKGRVYLGMAIFRFLALFSIVLLLCNPSIPNNDVYTEKSKLTILIDNSSSIADLGYDSISKKLVESLVDHKSLQQRFDINTLVFDQKLKPLDSLHYHGKQTNLYKALKLSSESKNKNQQAIVLLSDGNQTIGKDYLYAIERDSSTTIYPILMGDSSITKDFSIGTLNVNKYAYLKNKFPVEVFVNYQGPEPVDTKVNIYNQDKLLKSVDLKFDATTTSQTVNFEIEATKIGLQSFSVEVQALTEEKNTQNNRKSFAIDVIDQKSNIALISTILHPDLGAIKKSIASNEFREVKILDPIENEIQVEDFELFILYQPNESFKPLMQQLQQDERNYWIIGGVDTQWEFLNTLDLGFIKTPQDQQEEVLPIENSTFNMFGLPQLDIDHLPPLLNQMGTLDLVDTPQVILHQKVAGVDTMEPLLMVFEDADYKRAILEGEGIWRWRASSYTETGSHQQFDNYIGNLIQYLSYSSPRTRLEVNHESFYYENSSIELTATYYDKNYRLLNNAQLVLAIQQLNSDKQMEFPMVNTGDFYQADLNGLKPGNYTYTLKVSSEDISETGSLRILPFQIEKQFVNPNIKKLKQLADQYQGKFFFTKDVDNLIAQLTSSNTYVPVQKVKENIVPLINWKWLLVLAVSCLIGEWLLRKYNGLI